MMWFVGAFGAVLAQTITVKYGHFGDVVTMDFGHTKEVSRCFKRSFPRITLLRCLEKGLASVESILF
jgi:hypothetical protein